MSAKYPKTFHLPWSPGASSDDKILESADHFLNRELIITEKVDGGNCCLTFDGVFARTHGGIATHPSFNWIKARWATMRYDIPTGWSIFGENAYAKHSIAYNELPAFFMVFGIRDDESGLWFSWCDTWSFSQSIGLETIPVLWSGKVKSIDELRELGVNLLADGSVCGGEDIEGYVVRFADEFTDFERSVAKYVRADHVQTADHWMLQTITPNKMRVSMGKLYVVVEASFEYNDEIYQTTDGDSGEPVIAFRSKEKAKAELRGRTIKWLRDCENLWGYCYDASDIIDTKKLERILSLDLSLKECPHCEHKYKEDEKFCSECGKKRGTDINIEDELNLSSATDEQLEQIAKILKFEPFHLTEIEEGD